MICSINIPHVQNEYISTTITATNIYSLSLFYVQPRSQGSLLAARVGESLGTNLFRVLSVAGAVSRVANKMNPEKLLGKQFFKNHNFSPFQSSSSLSIRVSFCICSVIYTFFKRFNQLFL